MGNNPPPTPASTLAHAHLGPLVATPQSLQVRYHFPDALTGQEKLRRLHARMKKFPQCPHILTINHAHLQLLQQMCASNADVVVELERYEWSLGQVMAGRVREKRGFGEREIYEFLHQVLTAVVFLQDNGFKSCHLDKQSIVFCGKKVKILDMGIATSTPYQAFLDASQPLTGFYPPPELFRQLQQRNYEPYTSPKSDMFCLGMLLLELACLEPLDCYYNYTTWTIDYESLIHRVSRIGYSTEMKTLIAGMVEEQPELRLGLVACLERVARALNIETEVEAGLRRSRSSSTKMLKQLLTGSRRTIAGSQSNDNCLQRRPSQTSLTSMASVGYRQQEAGSIAASCRDNRQNKGEILSNETVSTFRNLVKSKTSSNDPKQLLNHETNKQNINSQKSTAQQPLKLTDRNPKPEVVQINRKKSFGTRTFFQDSYKYNSVTPKTQQYFDRINNKKEQSIFRLIEEEDNKSRHNRSPINQHSTSGVPNFSPVLPPAIPRVQHTSSIEKSTRQPQQSKQVGEFSAQQSSHAADDSQEKPIQSLAYKVRQTLDKMYKTTQSISSSEEKPSNLDMLDDNQQRIQLQNGCTYEGQLKNHCILEGNGTLYNPQGKVVYLGSWVNNLYDGLGVLYNTQGEHSTPDMRDLGHWNWAKYEGEFSRGEWQGFGKIYYAGGEMFTGSMRNGKANGYGFFDDGRGGITHGVWVNNRLQA